MSPQCSTEQIKFKVSELKEIERAMDVLRNAGFSEISAPMRLLSVTRKSFLSMFGLKAPRWTTLLKIIIGLSPGTIKLWHDADYGFFTEASERPGSPPVYRKVTDEVAVAILKEELTHELEATLMTPDEYVGE